MGDAVVVTKAHSNTQPYLTPPLLHKPFTPSAGRIDPHWEPPKRAPYVSSVLAIRLHCEACAQFIRKKLARRSTGSSPIGRSRGPLRLRSPQTFLRIIFSIPLLSSVRTDQIKAQGLHCEEPFQKVLFSMPPLFLMHSLSLLPHAPKKKVFPLWLSHKKKH